MNIMIFADQESKLLYEYYDPERMKDIDLIISCGDLPPEYLTFFATLCHAPLLYVKGNHDGKYEQPPEGCICIEDNIYVYKGVRILGWEVPWNIYQGIKPVYRMENEGTYPETAVEIVVA